MRIAHQPNKGTAMNAMYSAFIAIAVVAVAAWFGLHQLPLTTADVTSAPDSVRLDPPASH